MKEKEQNSVNETSLRHSPERLFPPQPESCELTLRCRRSDYSASLIARAVEDCDAHLLNLNVTSLTPESDAAAMDDYIYVDLRVGLRNVESVVRSLSRYGYDVTDVAGEEYVAGTFLSDSMLSRLGLLIRNLEI